MLKFNFQRNQTTFFKELKEKIDHYFAESNLDPAGNGRLYLKGAIQLLIAASLYTLLVFFTPVFWIAIPLCILFGLSLGVIGFNVMHEGGHQSFSKHPWINKAS